MPTLTVDSPLGPLALTSESGAVVRLDWADLPGEGADPVLAEAARQLADYFAGRRHDFDLPLRPAGTDFQRRAWTAMSAIPYGTVATYGQLARGLGSVARAVGGACGANPIPILVPCHRVVASAGQGGYSGKGGLGTKDFLLRLEMGIPALL